MDINDYTAGDAITVTFDDGDTSYTETGSFVEYDGTSVWVDVDGKIFSFDTADIVDGS
jgi:hypothetical protein